MATMRSSRFQPSDDHYQLVKRNTRSAVGREECAERASEEAWCASLAKASSRMSHEIRTPKERCIMGMTAIAFENAHDEEKASLPLEDRRDVRKASWRSSTTSST